MPASKMSGKSLAVERMTSPSIAAATAAEQALYGEESDEEEE